MQHLEVKHPQVIQLFLIHTVLQLYHRLKDYHEQLLDLKITLIMQ
jgi:hypothetical protein